MKIVERILNPPRLPEVVGDRKLPQVGIRRLAREAVIAGSLPLITDHLFDPFLSAETRHIKERIKKLTAADTPAARLIRENIIYTPSEVGLILLFLEKEMY